jgi:hypothetical protein
MLYKIQLTSFILVYLSFLIHFNLSYYLSHLIAIYLNEK